MDIRELMIYSRTLPERRAKYAPWLEGLHEEITKFLESQGIPSLYIHQAELFERAQKGENVVITTSTASGKTLSFLLPVIQKVLEDPQARAIFLYPTKALAADQYRAMEPIINYFGEAKINAGVYDGDTPPEERRRIRQNCNLILTNPEMLSGSFLPNHSRYGFDFLFSNLKYVVIDELHTYRGVFGSHMANVCRRLGRVTDFYGSHPQFLCSSATIANPQELAADICGKEFTMVDKDGSPSSRKTYTFVQPPRIEDARGAYAGQKQAAAVAADMIPELVEDGHSFIAFARSRRTVEVILREARDKLDAAGFLGKSSADQIAGYRGGYTPMQRHSIEKRMTNGQLKGLVSTNALELGIDIGHVDTTILVGYPGTRASFWQQTGRAGRSGIDSNNYMVLESQPFDQYLAVNPLWLFESGTEHAVIDRDNLLIELAHIRAAAAELPLTLNDIAVFPDLGEAIPVLLKVGELKSENGKFFWNGNAFPAGDFSMRNIDEKRYKLMDKDGRQITEMDETQAFHEIHEGAVYMHEGDQYLVTKLDLETRTASCVPFDGDYYTMPGSSTEVKVIREVENGPIGITTAACGDVNVDETVWMYKKLQFHNHQNLGFEKLQQPLSRDYDTESMWIKIPQEVVQVYRSLLQPDGNGNYTRNNHFDGLCHALKNAAMLETMSENGDIGVSMSSNVIGTDKLDGGEVFLYIYDKYVGGLGYAKKAYERAEQILDHAIELTSGCTCKDGCIACVGDYHLDRQVVLWGLRSLRESLPAPASYKYVQYAKRPQETKEFIFRELPERWSDFVQYLKQTGDPLANFLNTIHNVTVSGTELTLETANAFYTDWVMDKTNYRSLINIFRFHTDAPENIRIRAITEDTSLAHAAREKELKERITRRYRNLTKEPGQQSED